MTLPTGPISTNVWTLAPPLVHTETHRVGVVGEVEVEVLDIHPHTHIGLIPNTWWL